jgi:hypothetical protein
MSQQHAATPNSAQAEHQGQATRPGLAVRGRFSPARAWRPAVVDRLARTSRPQNKKHLLAGAFHLPGDYGREQSTYPSSSK